MLMRNWLQALGAFVCVLALTGCGDECVDQTDCRNKKDPAPAGKEYQCIENTCELRDKPPTEITCSPECASTEFCDTSSGQGVCRTCSATQGCSAPLFCDVAANSGKGLCRACSDTGNGTDQGCSATAPVCDPAAGNGAGACRACTDSAQGGDTDSGCSTSTPMCDPAAGNGAGVCKACVDSAQGNAMDLGCSASSPVCDAAAASGVGSCKACVDSAQGTDTDLGCADTAPICNTSASGGKGVCKACLDSAQGTDMDQGCSATTPICDSAASSGAGACKACVDSETGDANDLGCGGTTPLCDGSASNGAGLCRACVNSAQGTATDQGCAGTAPICDIAASSGAGACRVCLDTENPGSSTADLGCSSPTSLCDTAANNSEGACKVCLTSNEGCSGNQTCNAAGSACEGCANDTECTNASTPICKPPPPVAICVECINDTQCASTRPVCDMTTNICGCTDNTQCADAPGNTDFCDNAANNGRGQCKVCVTDSNCSILDPTKPYCDNQTACIQCRGNADCSLTQVCNATTKSCEAVPGADPATTSAQIAAVVAAANGALDPALPIENAFVTYIKPALSADLAGFFLQAEPNGPAIFVSDATALGLVQVGDRVTLQVTGKATTTGLGSATTVTGTTVVSSGHPVRSPSSATPAGLAVDRSSANDLQSSVANYESELISLTGTIASGTNPSGGGHVAFDINTAGITMGTLPRLRVPATLADQFGLARNCDFTLTSGPMWRFNANAQPSAYEASDLIVDCPAPKLSSARALNATEVLLIFDRKLNAATVQPANFTIGSLNVTAAASDGAFRVTLTTDAQTAAQAYTVTVAGEVTDLAGKSVDPTANTANFIGFGPPPPGPSLVINEIDADNPGTDAAEFIEIHNRGAQAADLTNVVLLLVNGDSTSNPRREYLRFPLTEVKDASGNAVTSLPPGGYIVAASSAYLANTPPPTTALRLTIAATGGTPGQNIIQNGDDGIGLLDNASGTLIDTVFYRGGGSDPVFTDFVIDTGVGTVTLSFLEGSMALARDQAIGADSIQRFPNGGDTNNNDYDFLYAATATPGAQNQ